MFLSRAIPSTILSSSWFGITKLSSLFDCYSVFWTQIRPTRPWHTINFSKNKGHLSAAHQTMRNKNASTAHPKSSGWAWGPAAVPCCCLCKGMGWLALKAQVHPGLSGFEKMDFSQINKHALLRIPLEAGLRLHPPDQDRKS